MTGGPIEHLVSEEEMERKGLMMNFEEYRLERVLPTTNSTRFYDKFNVLASTACLIYGDLQFQKYIKGDNTLLHWFLTALWYMKHYPLESEFESKPINSAKKYASRRVWQMIRCIQKLKHQKICFPQTFHDDEVFIMTVDGTDSWTNDRRTKEFSQDRMRFSKKFDQAGLAYELGISLTGGLIWMNGPFKAGCNDLKKFMATGGLKEKLLQIKKKAIADLGYPGQHEVIATPNPHDYDAVRKFKSRALKRHETFNGSVKSFAITSQRFRHSDESFAASFEAVCVVAQYKVENETPLFDVLIQDVVDREP